MTPPDKQSEQVQVFVLPGTRFKELEGLADLDAGDSVRVYASPSAEGKLEAKTVELIGEAPEAMTLEQRPAIPAEPQAAK